MKRIAPLLLLALVGCQGIDQAKLDEAADIIGVIVSKPAQPQPPLATNSHPTVTNSAPVVVPVLTNAPPIKPPPLRVDWTAVYRERAVGYYDGNAGTWHVRGIFPYPGLVACEMQGNKVVQFLKTSTGKPYDGKSGITDIEADWRVFQPVNVEDKSEDIGIVFYGRVTRKGNTFAVFDASGALLTSKVIR